MNITTDYKIIFTKRFLTFRTPSHQNNLAYHEKQKC